ncbi:MAG: hypothetical protein Q4G16_11075 [Cruoricaptor ignavus]|nr:hypothetical protein [Cruoricaptor ignavus]
MAHRYRNPKTILTPQDMISSVNVIYEDPNGVSVAIIEWDGKRVIGMRWNIALREWDDADKISGAKESLGVPTSRSYPTWFILPNEISDDHSDLSKILKNIKL